MARRHASSLILESIAGSALVGRGFFILFANLDGAAAQLKNLFRPSAEGLGMVSSVILAASFDHQRLLQVLLQTLVSFWPLLFVIGGAVLLRDVVSGLVKSHLGTQQIFPGKDTKPVDLTAPRSISK